MPHNAEVYPHHDLLNLAYYHHEIIQSKKDDDESEGIALDCMSCLLVLGHGVEALINFAGSKLVNGWNERAGYRDKLEQACDALGVNRDESTEPFKSLATLKGLRNQFAHAKPIRRSGVVRSKQDLSALLESDWDPYCTADAVQHIYEQVDAFEKIVYANEEICRSGVLTSAWGWSDGNEA